MTSDGIPARRSVDGVTVAAIMLTVDAVLFLLIAILGVPALVWLFGDENASWHRLWLVVVVWLVAGVLGPLCTAATLRIAGRGSYSMRRTATAAAVGTAVATGGLAVVSLINAPGFLSVMAALFAVANVAAARVFLAAPESAQPTAPALSADGPVVEPFTESDLIVFDEPSEAPPAGKSPAGEQPAECSPAGISPTAPVPADDPVDQATAKPTVDLGPVTGRRPVARPAVRNWSRRPAALRTLAGVQLPRRARAARR